MRDTAPAPAPWSVAIEDNTAIIRNARGRLVTSVSIYTNTDEANALVIAAAPGLLEACQQALPILVGYSWTDSDLAAVEALRDAIEKAKGR